MLAQEKILIIRLENLPKGRRRIHFENGTKCVVYASEIRGWHLQEDTYLSEEQYQKLLHDIVGKRAKRRALHLLEQMDRTEQQLRDKLKASEYPMECIEEAIEYVKHFRYVDDQRYAENFTRYRKDRMSRFQIKQKLMMKGVSQNIISNVLEDEYDVDEVVHIRSTLQKKHFSPEEADEGEFRRVYNYLLRRGFRSSDILKEMKCVGADW